MTARKTPRQPNGPAATIREPVPESTPLSATPARVARDGHAQEHE